MLARCLLSIALIGACSCVLGCDNAQAASNLHGPEVRSADLCLGPVPSPVDPFVRTARVRAQAARVEGRAPTRDAATAAVEIGYAFVRAARSLPEPQLYRNAAACAERALAYKPNDAAALALSGMVALNDHRFARARDLGRALIERDASDPVAWGLLSDAELELGSIDVATDAAQHMLDLKPSLMSYGRAAHLRWLRGDVHGAAELYRQAIGSGKQLADREPSAWMIAQAALVFWHAGDYAGAGAGFDLALHEVADYAPALEGKGRVALARGDYRDAARLFERARAREPLIERSWLLGDAYALLGDTRKAEAAYARVERDGAAHDPRTLALFYAVRDEEPRAALRLARAENSQRDDVYSRDVLAFALYRSGELQEALRLSRKVVESGTADARLLHRAGVIATAAGDAASGRALLEKAVRLNPGFDPLRVPIRTAD